jgi:hypothetical protein
VDEDCDGEELCYVDVDGDGYRPDDTTTAPSTALQCDVSGVLPADSPSGDCDDQAAAIHPGAEEVAGDELDQDCDGTELCYLDADSDGVRPDELSTVDSTDTDCSDEGEATALISSGDCDDSSSTINPDATELPGNGVDENCDGIELCYVDQDGDGYLPAEPLTVESSSLSCTDANQGSQSTPMTDCDDESAAIHPEATELPGDTVDQDCDGMELCYVDADGDGHRPESGTVESADLDCSDEGEATVTTSSDDCDDEDPLVYGGADEACDGVDSDCDGSLVDEFDDDDGDGVPGCLGEDSDGDGFRDGEDNCPSVANPEQDDLDGDKAGDLCDSDADGDQVPATSDCNDLDLSVSTLTTIYEDNDGDGFGEADASSQVCGTVPDGYLTVGDDNCPTLSNPDQLDTNEDGEGDACESFALQGNGIACGMVVPTERSKGSWAGAALVLLGFAMGIRRRRARLAD